MANQQWIELSLEKADRFSALSKWLGPMEAGMPLPAGWHWLYTHGHDPWEGLGEDGHPKHRPQGVPDNFSKRMWASSEVEIHRQPTIGEYVQIEEYWKNVEPKTGRSGALIFATKVIRLLSALEPLITEKRHIVYRLKQSAQNTCLDNGHHSSVTIDHQTERTLTEVDLFNYSSLIGVSHRIHYDYPYATRIEGYPGLVVHGPLQAQLLLTYLQNQYPRFQVKRFISKGLSPCYLGDSVTLNISSIEESSIRAWLSGSYDQAHVSISAQVSPINV